MRRSVLILLCFSASGVAGALRPVSAQVPPDEFWRSPRDQPLLFFRLGAALRLNSGIGSAFYLRLGTAF